MERTQIDEYHEAINGVVHAIKEQRRYLHDGMEFPDPTPMAPPLGYQKQPTLAERMRAMIRTHLSEMAANTGQETFEEADDFEIGDDYDPTSPYEEIFDPAPGATGGAVDAAAAELAAAAESRSGAASAPQAAPAGQGVDPHGGFVTRENFRQLLAEALSPAGGGGGGGVGVPTTPQSAPPTAPMAGAAARPR